MSPETMHDTAHDEFDDISDAIAFDIDPQEYSEHVSEARITTRRLRSEMKRRTVNAMKKQALSETVRELPAVGECLHIVSNGDFDYWTFIPLLAGYLGVVDELYASTWVINRASVSDLFAMIDEGIVKQASFLGGDFMKTGDTAVYATLLSGLRRRGMRLVCLRNHAKVTLLANHAAGAYLVLEGSANYTANPRIEQNILANDRELYEFHRDWMEEVLRHGTQD